MTQEMTATWNRGSNRTPSPSASWAFYENEPIPTKSKSTPGKIWVTGATNRQFSQAFEPDGPYEIEHLMAHLRFPQRSPHAGGMYAINDQRDNIFFDTEKPSDQVYLYNLNEVTGRTPMAGLYQNVSTVRISAPGLVVVSDSVWGDFSLYQQPETVREWFESALHAVIPGFAKGTTTGLPLSNFRDIIPLDPVESLREVIRSAASWQEGAGELSVVMSNGKVLNIRRIGELSFEIPLGGSGEHSREPLHPVVQAFANGFEGILPTKDTLEAASRLVEAAIEKAKASEIEVDETNGAVSFEIRLSNGHLVVGEFSVKGDLHVNVYADEHPDPDAGLDEIWVSHMPQATAADLIALL